MLYFVRFSAVSLLCSAAFAHNHITVDTVAGNAGDKILVKAGYNPSESAYSISNGRLQHSGITACYDLPDTFVSGPIFGWFGGDEVLLTSDFYFPTGRLNGGDFRWEIAAVTAVAGNVARVAWGTFDASDEFVIQVESDGDSRIARSFATPAGSHNHHQAYGIDSQGLYDVTFVVWDASGKFADSDPVLIRFRAGLPCAADLDPDGVVDDSDFVLFAQAYNVLDCSDAAMPKGCPADINLDGFVDDADFVIFIQSYDAFVCPTAR